MIDVTTNKPIRVTDTTVGPYLMVPVSQVWQVVDLLKQHEIRHWVESDALSLDGKPPVAWINLGYTGNSSRVQDILDRIN